MMLEAQDFRTGQRITLPGSRWSGLAVSSERAAEMEPFLRCANRFCGGAVRLDTSGRAFVHARGESCVMAGIHPGQYPFWVREDILGGSMHSTGLLVDPAKIAHTASGMGVAVRPAFRDGWSGGFGEHRADAAAGYASMWLVDEDAAKSDLSWTAGWVGKLARRAAQTSRYPISVGVLTSRFVRFVGDVVLESTEEGVAKTRVVTTTPPVPVSDLRSWATGGGANASPELAGSFQVLDFAAQRRIKVVSR